MVWLCGLPPIEQKTLDGWGTQSFHLSWVGFAGGRLNKNRMEGGKARWQMVGLCGLPPIEQKTLDGWGTQSFVRSRVGLAGGWLIQSPGNITLDRVVPQSV
jgi:serine protease inhibitor ecotin